MRYGSAGLKSWLSTATVAYRADLYTFVIGGSTYRWTSATSNLTISPNTWLSTGPTLRRSRTRLALGTEVSTLTIDMAAPSTYTTLGGVTLQAFAAAKGFDQATVRLDHLLMSTFGTTTNGAVWLFSGNVADQEVTDKGVRLTVKSSLERLKLKLPRRVITEKCQWQFGSTPCGVSTSTVQDTGASIYAAQSSPDTLHISTTLTLEKMVGAIITMTSGTYSGQRSTVASCTSTGIGRRLCKLTNPLTGNPANGNTLTVIPACDKTIGTCFTQYTNTVNFGGFPMLPRDTR